MKQSLFKLISDALDENGRLPESFSLPKDPDVRVPFADGAEDGIGIYHMIAPEITDDIREGIKNAVAAASDGDNQRAEELFCELSKKISVIRAIDELQSYIIDNRDTLSAENMYHFAENEILCSPDKNCVKFGLSIMELFDISGNEKLRGAVTALAASDEFTLFSLFIMLRWENGNEYIFNAAKKVSGWGRIHAVERLVPETDEIKRWILREGVYNAIVPAYSALGCWSKSGAEELLRSDETLSDEDFHGIRDIIDALLDEGPCSGISSVENAEDALTRFLQKASGRTLDVTDYETVRGIRDYCEENADIAALCGEILGSEQCRECVKSAVKNGEGVELAKSLGIDVKPDVLAVLEKDPEKHCYLCSYLMSDDEYRAKAIALFREKLPLGEMKAAPTTELGLGKEFAKERCLVDAIVQYLGKYPFEGIELIETSLQCAPTRNRHMALNALQGWTDAKQTPLSELLPDMFALLQRLKEIEPDEKVREKMEKLLNGDIDQK